MTLVRRRLAAVAALLLAAALLPGAAAARGWCNADHGGSDAFRSAVRAGAAGFASAVSQAWRSLAYVEADDAGGALEAAAPLADRFAVVGKSFQAAAGYRDETLAKAFRALDPRALPGIGEARTPIYQEMRAAVETGEYGRMLQICADLGFDMSQAAGRLVEALKADPGSRDADRAIWNLLDTMSRADALGWHISSVFAAAGDRMQP